MAMRGLVHGHAERHGYVARGRGGASGMAWVPYHGHRDSKLRCGSGPYDGTVTMVAMRSRNMDADADDCGERL